MYKNKKIIKDEEERKQILKKCYDDKITGHSDIWKPLKRIKEITF